MEAGSVVRPNHFMPPTDTTKNFTYRFQLGCVAITMFVIGTYLSWTSTAINILGLAEVIKDMQEASWVGSLLPLGGFLGTLPAGFLADKYGRKFTALFSTSIMFLGWCIICWTMEKAWIYVARFLAGIACGAASVVVPIYLYELTADSYKPKLERSIHETIIMGILIPYLIDPISSEPFRRPQIMLLALLVLIPLIMIMVLPESPIWLAARERRTDADRAVAKLIGNNDRLETREPEKAIGKSGLQLTALTSTNSESDIVLILSLIVFQQLSGIGMFTFYTQESLSRIVNVGVATWVFSFIMLVPLISAAVAEKLLKHLKEKTVILISTFLMTVCLFCLAAYSYFIKHPELGNKFSSPWYPMISAAVYFTAFHMGLGPIPWIIIGKVFPNSTRKIMYNLALTIGWAVLFVMTKIYIDILYNVEIYVLLLIYALMNLICMIFTFFALPRSINKMDVDTLNNFNEMHTNFREYVPNVGG